MSYNVMSYFADVSRTCNPIDASNCLAKEHGDGLKRMSLARKGHNYRLHPSLWTHQEESLVHKDTLTVHPLISSITCPALCFNITRGCPFKDLFSCQIEIIKGLTDK